MYNMFNQGSQNNSVIDPRLASMQPEPSAVSVAPVNPVVADDKALRKQKAIIAALQAMNTGNAPTSEDPWAAGITTLGNVGAAGLQSYFNSNPPPVGVR